MITKSELKKLFHYDKYTGLFTRLVTVKHNAKKGSLAGSVNSCGYLLFRVNTKKYRAHRMAWLYVYGANPKNEIDHINGDKLDNRIENLRDITSMENSRNRTTSINKFGVVGLSWCKKTKKFYSRITIKRKTECLGYYFSMFDAICARKSAENKYNFRCKQRVGLKQ